MGFRVTLSIAVTVISVVCTRGLEAQESRLNTNLGVGMNVPLNPTAQVIGSSLNVVVGAGYNFSKHHSLVGQFMWAGLPIKREAFLPIDIVANRRDISASSNLFTATANYRFRLEGRTFGWYWIAGGGAYYRRVSLSREVVVGSGVVCSPSWLWWGYTCANGLVTQDQTLFSNGSTAFGVNGGTGFTIRINDEGYKFYVESRYHYAPTRNINTQLITITLGFAW